MIDKQRPAPGSLVWTDLLTSGLPDLLAFYQQLFGWDFRPANDGDAAYHMCLLGGRSVCSIGDVASRPGAHAGWTLYIGVDSADKAAEEALSLGGTILVGPLDVATEGRLALAADPAGGVLGLWEGRDHVGAETLCRPGALSGADLSVADPAMAGRYYSALFGWRVQPLDGDALVIDANGADLTIRPAASTVRAAGAGGGWTVRFKAVDPTGVADRITALGGRANPAARGGAGTLVAADPVGNAFAVTVR